MPAKQNPRLRFIVLLTGGVILVFALLGALQAFNTSRVSFLNPDTSGETLAFVGLTVVLFLLLIALLMLLLRNLLKLSSDQGSALGARLRTRMVLGAALIAVTPATFMFLFSFFLMNRTIDRWFSPNTSELRADSIRVVRELAQYVAGNARSEAETIAASGAADQDADFRNSILTAHRVSLEGGFTIVYAGNRRVITAFDAPPDITPSSLVPRLPDSSGDDETPPPAIPLKGPLYANLLTAAQNPGEPMVHIANQDYALGLAKSPGGNIVLAALPMPQGLSQTTARIRAGATSYWQLFRARNQIRSNFFLLLLVVTVFVFFSGVWLAIFLSKQITRPVAALADAMNAIAAGKYEQRVELLATGEMADLVRSFNHMAADLETSRQRAATSSAQLTTANLAIEERRRELETILETIPSGVVTLDAAGVILQANRAFAVLIGESASADLRGSRIESLLPQEGIDEISTVIRRGRRMGAASAELELHIRGHIMHLAVSSARLDLAHGKLGTVLVAEDTSELLRAQRQMAWKEVAQRVAHEIKNPLTPIALSAERIARHVDRAQPDSPSIIRKCSEVILNSVGTLRTLVDQFSALAQFPAPQPRPCDLNRVADEALALFAGRLDGISVTCDLAPGLPLVMADPNAIRRAFANLIDNAAEAMQGSLLRVLAITSTLSEDGAAVELTVSDTGHGLTDEIRERLFLPFYSTKHRGTGLGLSIAAKIVQEHGGSIRAESNMPKGARFLVTIPLIQPAPAHPSEAVQQESTKEVQS